MLLWFIALDVVIGGIFETDNENWIPREGSKKTWYLSPPGHDQFFILKNDPLGFRYWRAGYR